jgi:hypothetical protein
LPPFFLTNSRDTCCLLQRQAVTNSRDHGWPLNNVQQVVNNDVRGQPVETFSFRGPVLWVVHPPRGPSTGHQPLHTCSPAAFSLQFPSIFSPKLCIKLFLFRDFCCGRISSNKQIEETVLLRNVGLDIFLEPSLVHQHQVVKYASRRNHAARKFRTMCPPSVNKRDTRFKFSLYLSATRRFLSINPLTHSRTH